MNTLKTFLLLSALLYVSSLNTKIRGYKSLSKSNDNPTVAVSSNTSVEVTPEVTPSSQPEVNPPPVTTSSEVVQEVTTTSSEGTSSVIDPEDIKPVVRVEIKGDEKQSVVNRLEDIIVYASSDEEEEAQVLLEDAQAVLDVLKNSESVDINEEDNKILFDRLINSLGYYKDVGAGNAKEKIDSLGDSIIEVFGRVRSARSEQAQSQVQGQGEVQGQSNLNSKASGSASASVEGGASASNSLENTASNAVEGGASASNSLQNTASSSVEGAASASNSLLGEASNSAERGASATNSFLGAASNSVEGGASASASASASVEGASTANI